MIRFGIWIFVSLIGQGFGAALAQTNHFEIVGRRWYETRTAHFQIYTCGEPGEISRLSLNLERFCETYSRLAGARAIESPPIIVVAFPDHESFVPFLPLYQSKPRNLAGFFSRGDDENLIVLGLPSTNSAHSDMDVIYHEYTHVLLRNNDLVWPLWLQEGMAEIYSTFKTDGSQVRIARPISHHLRTLHERALMPLSELFAVSHESPEYNESDQQGIFYAESWLLAHYLISGDNPAFRNGFHQFTPLLQQGQTVEQAFTNSLHAPLHSVEVLLRRYLERGQFPPVELTPAAGRTNALTMSSRFIAPVETCFRLGDELLRIRRIDDAEVWFLQAKKISPASPLSYEGLGFVAAERKQHTEAAKLLADALQRGSSSFLVYFTHARERYRQTADSEGRYAPLPASDAESIRVELQKSLNLMPAFAPAHELLGFVEMVQGTDLRAAAQHLQLAIQLEPDNPSYLLSLAQAQARMKDPATARRTLEPLLVPSVDAQVRAHAQEIMREIDREFR